MPLATYQKLFLQHFHESLKAVLGLSTIASGYFQLTFNDVLTRVKQVSSLQRCLVNCLLPRLEIYNQEWERPIFHLRVIMERFCNVCNKKANFSCGSCKVVNYCSKDHQRQDWKVGHKSACQPMFRLETNERLGRYMVATKDIRKGDLIFQEPPLVVGPKPLTSAVCLGCHSSSHPGGRECDGCGYLLCSVQCQVSDAHFDECHIMMNKKFRGKINPETPNLNYYSFIAPLRILLLKDKSPEKYKKVMIMQAHLESRRNTALYLAYKHNVANFLQERLGFTDFDTDTILTICGILDTNAFEVRTRGCKLRGMYATASMMAHDCMPNTRHTFHGPELAMAVSATVDIPSGAPITTTYTQTFWSTMARRAHLRTVKCFDCCCKRCSDPTEFGTYLGTFRCIRCATRDNYADGPKMVSTDPLEDNAPWRCKNCGHEIAAKLVRAGNDNLSEEIASLDKTSTVAMENFLTKYGVESVGVLHPTNTFVIQVKHALVQTYGNRPGSYYADLSSETLEKKIDYCHDLLEVIDALEPGYTRIRGQILGELQAAMTMKAKQQYDEGAITKKAAQDTLAESMAILGEVIEIMKNEPDAEDLRLRLQHLAEELDY